MALTCLLDTSVWNRLDRAPTLAAEVTTLLRHGEVGYSDIERLEVLRSARHTDHYRRLAAMFAALPKVALTEAALVRAGQVQEQLVQQGHHRGVKIPDLLIAAAATALSEIIAASMKSSRTRSRRNALPSPVKTSPRNQNHNRQGGGSAA